MSTTEEKTGKNPPKNPPQQRKKWQSWGATPEQKKAWWDRKKQAQAMMDRMLIYQNMSLEEFTKAVTEQGDKIKIGELITAKRMKEVLKDKRFLLDWISKHIPQAQANLSIGNDPVTGIEIKIGEKLPPHIKKDANTDKSDTQTGWAI